MSITIKIAHKVSDEHLHHLFTTAIEGGITYWAGIVSYHWSKPGTNWENDLLGFEAKIVDAEESAPNGDSTIFTINRETIITGVRRIATGRYIESGAKRASVEHRLHMTKIILAEDADAYAADAVVQIALFSELRYA